MSKKVNFAELGRNLTAFAEATDSAGAVLETLKATLSPLVIDGKVDKDGEDYGKVRDEAARVLRVAFFRKDRKGVDMAMAKIGAEADDKTARGWDKQDPRKIGRAACFGYARRAWQVITENCLPSSSDKKPSGKASNGKAAQGETAPPMTPEVLLGAIDALIVTLSVDAGRAFLHSLRNNCKAYGTYLDAGKPVPKAV